MKLILFIICCVLADLCKSEYVEWSQLTKDVQVPAPLSDELISFINNEANTTWKAGRTNRFKNINEAKNVLGVLKPSGKYKLPYKTNYYNGISLPTSFDARIRWPYCSYIKEIRDQSNCGSCWVFGAVEAMTDRYCIHSRGLRQIRLSAEDPLTCCTDGYGCNGGMPLDVWRYWVKNGIVTGGPFGSHQGCQDYSIPPRNWFFDEYLNTKIGYPTPPCVKECQPGYKKSFQEDKNYGKSAYSIPFNEEAIMKEIFENGPVEASFTVYADFFNYNTGVYQHKIGQIIGGHAVKMLGWGTENGTPYWLMANSWGRKWGEKGFFKIKRGENECGIEEDIVAGIPNLQKT